MTFNLEERLASVSDKTFRNRALIEYKTVAKFVFPHLNKDKKKLRILDFGCGQGIAAASFALHMPHTKIFGIDVASISKSYLESRLQQLLEIDYPQNLTIESVSPGHIPDHMRNLDLVYSWSVFEHIRFHQLQKVLAEIRSSLKPSGIFFLQISPLYFSPRGSHLYSILSEPWAHLLTQLDVLHEQILKADKPDRTKLFLIEQFNQLNRVTANDIIDQCRLAGFTILKKQITCVDREPPERLLRAYNRNALIEEQLIALFKI